MFVRDVYYVSGRTQKLYVFPEIEKREVESRKISEIQSSIKNSLFFSSQNDKMYTWSQFFKQNFSRHKIMVSDFWKYIKSNDALSRKLGDIYWISSREYFQNWHSDYVIKI